MQTGHHISMRWVAAGYGSSIISFLIMALFLVDVFNVTPSEAGSVALGYNANTSYLFHIGYWLEVAIALVALVAGMVLAVRTFDKGHGL